MEKKWLFALILMMFLSGFPVFALPSNWAQEDLNILAEYDVLDETFFRDYQADMTRGDFIYLAVTLYEALLGEEISIDPSIQFVDTDDQYVLKGASAGIVSGIGDRRFGPNNKLTREQLATIIVHAIELAGINLTASSQQFTDDDQVASYAKTSIYKASNHNMLNGYNGKVNPKGHASREQAMLIFKNSYDHFVLPPAVTFVQAEAVSTKDIKVTWDANDADYYYIYDFIDEGEWYQIKNVDGGFAFTEADSKGILISGYETGQSVYIAVEAIKSSLRSDVTLSNPVKVQSLITKADTLDVYLKENFMSFNLNDIWIDFDLFEVLEYAETKVSLFAYVSKDSFTRYLGAELLGLPEVANDMKEYAEHFKSMLDKDVSITIIYTDIFDASPSGLDTNYMYADPVIYDSSQKVWQVYYPLINVDTSFDGYITWYAMYRY